MPESTLAERMGDIEREIAPLTLAYLPGLDGVDLRLSAWRLRPEEAERRLARRPRCCASAGAIACTATVRPTSPHWSLDAARARGPAIVTAESCTGGLVGGRLTEIPGSSDVYLGGVVCYADELKIALLGVDRELIAREGAVSEAVALAMAAGPPSGWGHRRGLGHGHRGSRRRERAEASRNGMVRRRGGRRRRSAACPARRAAATTIRARAAQMALHLSFDVSVRASVAGLPLRRSKPGTPSAIMFRWLSRPTRLQVTDDRRVSGNLQVEPRPLHTPGGRIDPAASTGSAPTVPTWRLPICPQEPSSRADDTQPEFRGGAARRAGRAGRAGRSPARGRSSRRRASGTCGWRRSTTTIASASPASGPS